MTPFVAGLRRSRRFDRLSLPCGLNQMTQVKSGHDYTLPKLGTARTRRFSGIANLICGARKKVEAALDQ